MPEFLLYCAPVMVFLISLMAAILFKSIKINIVSKKADSNKHSL